MPYRWVAAATSTKTWKIWCELPQMSNVPGYLRSGNRTYVSVSRCTIAPNYRNTYSVKCGSDNIEDTLQNNPSEAHPLVQVSKSRPGESVQNRHNPRHSQADEHERPIWPPLGGAEVLKP